ncbi:MAG: LacI family DNA-binding transcriptional regulator [Eubacteriales bacterium]|jgi:DNA-binding LacI/PurR family transcriptional regulator
MQKKRVTIKDVAREAGVSAMAVSQALNHRGRLSAETRERILQVADSLGYVPNNIAKSLRVSETRTIGVVVSDCSQILMAKILKGIEDVASHHGYSVIISNTNADKEAERQSIATLMNQRIDGLILTAPLNTSLEDMQTLRNFGIPFVILMRRTTADFVDFITNDNIAGGYEIARHLLEKEVRPLKFIALPSYSTSGVERMQGYQKAMKEFGVPMKKEDVLSSRPYIEDGFAAMNRLLDKGMTSGAVCCGSDLIAIGAIDAILKRGLRVPEDIQVSGYDDIDFLDYFRIPLTTMRQPQYEIGQTGANILIEKLQNPSAPIKQIILKSQLIVRESC